MTDPYLRPSGTLSNRLGIDDPDVLADAEAELSAARLIGLETGQGPGLSGDCLRDLKALHGYIFQDVYDWAGTTRAEPFLQATSGGPRTVQTRMVILKARKAFARPDHRSSRLDAVGRTLREAHHFRNIKRLDFFSAVGDLLLEINDVHAFREGNGRTQRAYVQSLARDAGREIDFKAITSQRMISASIAADKGDPGPMRRLIRDATSRERVTQIGVAKRILEKAGFEGWNDRYVGFVEPGRRHKATLVGMTDRHFTCMAGRSAILIGWVRDLPRRGLKPGDRIDFTGRGAPTGEIARPRSAFER